MVRPISKTLEYRTVRYIPQHLPLIADKWLSKYIFFVKILAQLQTKLLSTCDCSMCDLLILEILELGRLYILFISSAVLCDWETGVNIYIKITDPQETHHDASVRDEV